MNKILIISTIIVVIIVIVGIGYFVGRWPIQDTRETIKIGAVLSLTGYAKQHGQNIREGIELATAELNALGGINGREIEIVYEDDATDPKNTVTAVRKLINIDKVDLIIGPTWDYLANAVIPVLNEERKIALAPSVAGDTIEIRSPYFFPTFPPVAFKQGAVERFLNSSQGQRIGVITINNVWGLAHLEAYKKAIEVTDNELAQEIILPEFDGNDIASELSAMKDANLDIILFILSDADSISFVKKIKELNIQVKLLGNERIGRMIQKGEQPEEVIKAVEGIYVVDYALPSEGFIKKFKEAYGKTPSSYSDTAYDTIFLIAQVIEQYGIDTESMKQGLKEVEYIGASGAISFDENNFSSNKQAVLLFIKDGKVTLYEE